MKHFIICECDDIIFTSNDTWLKEHSTVNIESKTTVNIDDLMVKLLNMKELGHKTVNFYGGTSGNY